MTLFTVQLEIGPETRAMIERLASSAMIHFEFGPETRETLNRLFSDPDKRDGREGVLRKGVDALRK